MNTSDSIHPPLGQQPAPSHDGTFSKIGGLGLGAIALQSLLARRSAIACQHQAPIRLRRKPPMFAPKAKRVIYLHMAGSPSQLELFEHKPELEKLHLKDCPPSFLEGKRFAFIKGVPKILAGQFQFQAARPKRAMDQRAVTAFRQGRGQDLCHSHRPDRSVQPRAGTACSCIPARRAWAIPRWGRGSLMAWAA